MSPLPSLDAHTGYLLRAISNAVSQEFARKIADEEVTVAEWVFLRSLYGSDPIPPSVLAVRMGMTKGAISKLAARLTDKGLIERFDNIDDLRGHSVSLTTAGARKVPALARIADENDATFFAILSEGEHRSLRSLLHLLIDKLKLSAAPVD